MEFLHSKGGENSVEKLFREIAIFNKQKCRLMHNLTANIFLFTIFEKKIYLQCVCIKQSIYDQKFQIYDVTKIFNFNFFPTLNMNHIEWTKYLMVLKKFDYRFWHMVLKLLIYVLILSRFFEVVLERDKTCVMAASVLTVKFTPLSKNKVKKIQNFF